jgi:opacity protein-like surface antigen
MLQAENLMRLNPCVLVAAIVALALTPRPARADGLIVPFVGADFGGDAGNCEGITPCSSSQLAYGVGIGFMVGGVVGFEGEFAYAPHFFGEGDARGDNHVLTVMANVLAGVPAGPVRPYVVGGVGVINTDISQSSIGLFNAYSNNSFALNFGGGLMILFSAHVGVRGDLRYLRTLQEVDFPQFGFDNKQLQFGRGTVGVVFRF